MKIKNITNGPKGVNTPGGPVEIGAGQVADLDLNDAELASSKRTGWFEFGHPKADAPEDEPEAKQPAAAKGK